MEYIEQIPPPSPLSFLLSLSPLSLRSVSPGACVRPCLGDAWEMFGAYWRNAQNKRYTEGHYCTGSNGDAPKM